MEEGVLISYHKLRRILGILGIALPFVLVLGSLVTGNDCQVILPSISDYYHTSMQNIFVGIICAIAVFLWTYNGHDSVEKTICIFAAIFAILIAFAPTPASEGVVSGQSPISVDAFKSCYLPSLKLPDLVGYIHFASAALFFILLSILVCFKFPASEPGVSRAKRVRKKVYVTCGAGMFLSIVIIAVFKFLLADTFPEADQWPLPPTFTLEALALIFFGIAWLVKGELLFQQATGIFRIN